jgi:hypothetical protein
MAGKNTAMSRNAKPLLGLIAGVALSALSITTVHAAPGVGSNEVQVAAGFFHAQGSDSGNFNADLSYGYYLTPGWEIGFRQALNYNFIDGARDFWVATTTPFLLYNFKISDIVVPYLGVQGGLVWNDQKITGTFGPNAGLKLFLTGQTFLNIGYRYEWFFHSIRSAENNRTRGNHIANIGLGFVWGGQTTTTR